MIFVVTKLYINCIFSSRRVVTHFKTFLNFTCFYHNYFCLFCSWHFQQKQTEVRNNMSFIAIPFWGLDWFLVFFLVLGYSEQLWLLLH